MRATFHKKTPLGSRVKALVTSGDSRLSVIAYPRSANSPAGSLEFMVNASTVRKGQETLSVHLSLVEVRALAALAETAVPAEGERLVCRVIRRNAEDPGLSGDVEAGALT